MKGHKAVRVLLLTTVCLVLHSTTRVVAQEPASAQQSVADTVPPQLVRAREILIELEARDTRAARQFVAPDVTDDVGLDETVVDLVATAQELGGLVVVGAAQQLSIVKDVAVVGGGDREHRVRAGLREEQGVLGLRIVDRNHRVRGNEKRVLEKFRDFYLGQV